ncbi:hypothetical protein POVWA2_023690 [Plasmodium ovale wallikeri]|uniref:Uncharacterized protein n=1 Tax=Plasmodium ovale wallikeri TaxID=864142 RepID=A0A1A8YUI4_PLAOA|nr:hypothetical protein POVWA2_023690 [Plasmodium ovale wallikeri]
MRYERVTKEPQKRAAKRATKRAAKRAAKTGEDMKCICVYSSHDLYVHFLFDYICNKSDKWENNRKKKRKKNMGIGTYSHNYICTLQTLSAFEIFAFTTKIKSKTIVLDSETHPLSYINVCVYTCVSTLINPFVHTSVHIKTHVHCLSMHLPICTCKQSGEGSIEALAAYHTHKIGYLVQKQT